MESKLKEKLINEAQVIGDRIAGQKILLDHGIGWQTLSLDTNRKHIWSSADHIYGGNAGILLFYIDLYEATRNENDLKLILQAADALIRTNSNIVGNHSYYTGTLGIACTLWKVGDLVLDKYYHEEALQMVQRCTSQSGSVSKINDLLNGKAGMILGLLHMFMASDKDWILPKIDALIGEIIADIHLGEQGVYWDRSQDFIRGLCGFSHGAAGISFVFMELSHHFGNEAFQWLAEEAIKYENMYYSERDNNWPDFRKSFSDDQQEKRFKEAYSKNDYSFFTEGRDMSAWCHGAPGIIVSRVRAYQISGKEQHLTDLKRAMQKTAASLVHNPLASPTLCHGLAGNALALHIGNQIIKSHQIERLITQAAEECCNDGSNRSSYLNGYQVSSEREDPSLFMGSAGIGYFYLRMASGNTKASILNPAIPDRKSTSNSYFQQWTIDKIRNQIVKKQFSRTFSLIKAKKNIFYSDLKQDAPLKVQLTNEVERHLQNASPAEIGIFKLERKKMALDNGPLNSGSYLKTRELVEGENLKTGFINKSILRVSETIVFGTSSYQGADHNLLYYLTPTGVKEIEISDVQMVILEFLKSPSSPEEIIKKIMSEAMEGYEEHQITGIRGDLTQNIDLLFHRNFLLLA